MQPDKFSGQGVYVAESLLGKGFKENSRTMAGAKMLEDEKKMFEFFFIFRLLVADDRFQQCPGSLP